MLRAPFYLALVLQLAVLTASGIAAALTPEERAGARAAAERGAQAFDAGNYEEAIDYFTRAEKLVHAPPHLLYMARAHERLGQLVLAREAYLKIDREDLSPNAPRAFRDAQDLARQELSELEPRIPHVSVVVQGGGGKEVEVFRDGEPIPSPLVGIPQPMDPGEHSFYAEGPGVKSSVQKVEISEGAEETVVLTLKPAPGAGEASTPEEADQQVDDAASPKDGQSDGSSPALTIAGFTGLGIGVAGVAVGSVYALLGAEARALADDEFIQCDPGCTTEERDRIRELDSESNTKMGVGAVGLAAGGAVMVTGVTLLIIDAAGGNRSAGAEKSAGVSVRPLLGLGSVGLQGRF